MGNLKCSEDQVSSTSRVATFCIYLRRYNTLATVVLRGYVAIQYLAVYTLRVLLGSTLRVPRRYFKGIYMYITVMVPVVLFLTHTVHVHCM